MAKTSISPDSLSLFFFNDTATTEIYTLSLHDALPISHRARLRCRVEAAVGPQVGPAYARSEEHTSELQSQSNLVCRLLLEKKKIYHQTPFPDAYISCRSSSGLYFTLPHYTPPANSRAH